MSETRDRRRRLDLDLFVLALIDSGVATPYELQQRAGLSPGATIPALDRLLQTGMAQQGKPGSRGRVEYRVTRSGEKSLATGWRTLVDEGPSGDLDADLRVALLAVWIGDDRKAATGFLRQAASRKRQFIKSRKEPGKPASLAEWYRQLRSASLTDLLEGEAIAALGMAKALQRINPFKHPRKNLNRPL